MLDVEVLSPPTAVATDIVSLAEMKKHLRISQSNTAMDSLIADAIEEAVDKLDGKDGELNRSVLPRTWCRYLAGWPAGRVIRLPYPPLISVASISYDNGESPLPEVPVSNYVVRTGGLIGEVELKPGHSWPSMQASPRSIGIVFTAGYLTYPPKLKRMIKILAAHYFENAEATINEPRQMMINRAVAFGMDDLRAALRVPLSYDDWID